MNKMVFIVMALLMALLVLTPSLAEEAVSEEQGFVGIWTDVNYDRMQLTILSSEMTWFDERMGEDADAGKYVVRMVWPSSASQESVYNMVAVLDESGKKLTYEGGMFAEYAYDENGDVNEEDTCLVEDNGVGSFTLTEEGTLLWHDSYLEDADKMVLRRNIAAVPSAEDIKASYYQDVTDLETATAGASLKLAEVVRDTYVFCMVNPFWCMDKEAFSKNLAAAQEQLTAEEKAAFDQNCDVLVQEIKRLLQENEELGGVYTDAGMEKQMIELRNSPDIRYSVETFLDAVEALNEKP